MMSEELREAIEEMGRKGEQLERSIVALTAQIEGLVRDIKRQQETEDVIATIVRGAR